MNLNFSDGLLFSSVSITHSGKRLTIPDVVIDTGAAESILSIDAVDEIFNSYEPEDQIRFMTGIGGREASIRRRIDQVQFDSYIVKDFHIDFGRIGECPGINGLIGLDLLIPGKFIVDLYRFEIYTVNSK